MVSEAPGDGKWSGLDWIGTDRHRHRHKGTGTGTGIGTGIDGMKVLVDQQIDIPEILPI
ncbi:predicted protein [Sclerotinia sclerotiorum 1980 UF-70]|uniref:Uncharacterized protein n=1 Tax=Sclerotinia sclerotiorum (strain ATCC 18683 / 1980 / Ss-1) TaxID=665079 RepID=A7ENS7_SCLS1|nr:predicted protein [Sclerotinia sclerotiorum 1980 UF-70]EDO04493.1 predicted protein [Sclerotinia sclerotiorum 1980 UF-70]